MSDARILAALKGAFVVPSGADVIQQAIDSVLGDKAEDSDWIKSNFSHLVDEAQRVAYGIYLSAEGPAASRAIRDVFGSELGDKASADDVFQLIEKHFYSLDRFFLGLTQGRRPRAGKAFEYVLKVLFDKLSYPYTPQPIINGQPDFLLPSVEHFRENAVDCIIFTAKRTLRERWRQITTEGLQGYLFYLATIDENIGSRDLEEIKKSRIYLVVPKSLKAKKYADANAVISFEVFFRDHLDPAMRRWHSNGVIK